MNHKWDYDNEKRIAGVDTPDGCDRNEKTCLNCSVIKVTILPQQGFPRHEYRTKDGGHMVWPRRPECVPTGEPIKLKEAG